MPTVALKERRLEAAPGIEPGIKVLQTHALPLGYAAALFMMKILLRRN